MPYAVTAMRGLSMNSVANERNWLFDPSHLKLVQQCRRLIQSEFGVKLHLNEDHLAEHLAEYAGKTRSKHLVHTWEALKQRVPELGKLDAQPAAAKTYRGQEIAGSEEETGGDEARARKKQVIYRGRVVGSPGQAGSAIEKDSRVEGLAELDGGAP